MHPYLSIITPMHNEAAGIEFYFDKLIPILNSTGLLWEIIVIDDGSSDTTFAKLADKSNLDTHIKVIKFSRNFGKEAALTAGIDFASGEAVIPLDADLQDPPELIPQLIEKWQEGYDVVLAKRAKRAEDSWFKRSTAKFFYQLMRKISHVEIPPNVGDYRLISRKVINVIKKMPERVRFMKGILSWPGFKTTAIFYERPQRIAGHSSFNVSKLIKLALDGIFSFSDFPLRIWTLIGISISILSFTYALIIIFKTLLLGIKVPGYASLITIILFMGGIQLVSLGVMGEYISRIYLETKQRPIYCIDEKLGLD